MRSGSNGEKGRGQSVMIIEEHLYFINLGFLGIKIRFERGNFPLKLINLNEDEETM